MSSAPHDRWRARLYRKLTRLPWGWRRQVPLLGLCIRARLQVCRTPANPPDGFSRWGFCEKKTGL